MTDEEQDRLDYERQLAEYRRARDAFVAIFGPTGKPTPYGAVVLEYLDKFAGRGKLQIAEDRDGATDIPRTFRNVGRREVADAIHDMIAWKEPPNVSISSGSN